MRIYTLTINNVSNYPSHNKTRVLLISHKILNINMLGTFYQTIPENPLFITIHAIRAFPISIN